MSLSTPPPCSSPRQNHGMCGPLCSSAARARYGRPVIAAPRAQSRFLPASDLRREDLVLEVAVVRFDARDEIATLVRLGDVARERLLAREALERSAPALDRVDDLLDVLDARVIRAGEPDRVDRRIGDHVGDRLVGAAVADVELARERRGAVGVLAVGLQTPSTSASRMLANPCM